MSPDINIYDLNINSTTAMGLNLKLQCVLINFMKWDTE